MTQPSAPTPKMQVPMPTSEFTLDDIRGLIELATRAPKSNVEAMWLNAVIAKFMRMANTAPLT